MCGAFCKGLVKVVTELSFIPRFTSKHQHMGVLQLCPSPTLIRKQGFSLGNLNIGAWWEDLFQNSNSDLSFVSRLVIRVGPAEWSEVIVFDFQWKHYWRGYCRPQTVVVTLKSDKRDLAVEQAKWPTQAPADGIIQDCFHCESSTGRPVCWRAVFLLNLGWGLCPLAPMYTQSLWAQLEFFISCVYTAVW